MMSEFTLPFIPPLKGGKHALYFLGERACSEFMKRLRRGYNGAVQFFPLSGRGYKRSTIISSPFGRGLRRGQLIRGR